MSTTFSTSLKRDMQDFTSPNNKICLSVPVGRKHFSFDDRDRKKKRRKQLNPVRLSLEHVHQQLEDDINRNINNSDTILCEKHIKCSDDATESTYSVKTIDETPISSETTINDNLDSSVPLNLTKNSRIDNCLSNSSLIEHQTQLHSQCIKDESPKHTSKNSKIETESPPNYDHFMINSFADDLCKDMSPPFSPRTPPTTVIRNLFTNAVNRTTCRIFNPEAFCNICNKEFCNKYFLKTHKANKHGVYCENKDIVVSSDSELPSAIPLMFTWNTKNNNIKIPSNPFVFNANAVKDSSAFCSICEKEFCNKYFLRRHKEKMHGIAPPLNEYRKSDTGSESDNKYSDIDDSNEKDVRMLFTGDDTKYYHDDSCKNELNHNTVNMNRNNKDDRAVKCSKYSSNVTDAVSNFIKIRLTNENKLCSNNVNSLDNVSANNVHLHDNQENAINLMKKGEDNAFIYKQYNYQNLSSNSVVENCDNKNVSTGEFGVQAKEEDFHELSNSDNASVITANTYQHISTEESSSIDEVTESTVKYTCDYCKKSLSTYAIMRLHQKYVHASLDDSVLESKDNDSEFKYMENVYFMILKFSWLNTVVTYCEICKTEFDKNDILEMHLMNKHSSLVDEISRIIEDAGVNGLSLSAVNIGDGNILCQICNKTFSNNIAFQQHIYDKCNFSDFKDSDCSSSILDDTTFDSSKTRNFCEICKKELCNKYFMKTHMRRMHGISIQNGVRIGGVTCEICNKELCSKYFLRVHKKNCHGIMESMQFAKLLVNSQECEKEEQQQQQQKQTTSQICIICGRIFKSMKWLKTHLFNDHGKLGTNAWQDLLSSFNVDESCGQISADDAADMSPPLSHSLMDVEDKLTVQIHQCTKCQFQTSALDVLLNHQKLHKNSIGQRNEFQYRCMYCFIVTKDKVTLDEHIAYHHFNPGTDFQTYFIRARDKSQYEMAAIPNGNCNE